MVTDDGLFSFSDVQLESKNKDGKFYLECPGNNKMVYEVSHNVFKAMLVQAADVKTRQMMHEVKTNTFEYLFSQLELNEDMFAAMMFEISEWIH